MGRRGREKELRGEGGMRMIGGVAVLLLVLGAAARYPGDLSGETLRR